MTAAMSMQRLIVMAMLLVLIISNFIYGGSSPWSSERVGECRREDVIVHQAATTPLPNGIPTYTVQVLNVCFNNCSIGGIHLRCGWFSSARLINPRVFRRLRYNDCLVNDGQPISAGFSVSFQYANSFSYPMDVSSMTCLPSQSP